MYNIIISILVNSTNITNVYRFIVVSITLFIKLKIIY